MSRTGEDGTKGEARGARKRAPRGQAFWIGAVIALPVALVVWVAVTTALTLALADFVLAGLIGLGVLAALGCLLVLSPRSRGSGVGVLAALVPCALGLSMALL